MGSRKKKFNQTPQFVDDTNESYLALQRIFNNITPPKSPKHNNQNIPPLSNLNKDTDILQINDTFNFIEYFKSLDYSQKEDILRKLIYRYHNGDLSVPTNEKFSNVAKDKDKIIATLPLVGLKFVQKMHYHLHREEKHIIRMDFYGTIDATRPDRNSKEYKQTQKSITDFPIEEYDLNKSSVWKLFRHFKNFRQLENKMIVFMQQSHLPPSIISHLNAYDYSDILYNMVSKLDQQKLYKKINSSKTIAVNLFSKAPKKFVIEYVSTHEQEIRDYLHKQNLDNNYIEDLLFSMKDKGTCRGITPHNLTYTPQIIENLQANNIPCNNRLLDKPISNAHKQLLKKYKLSHLLIAHDAKGNDLKIPELNYNVGINIPLTAHPAHSTPQIRIFNGSKRSFVKNFIRQHEIEFRDILLRNNIDFRYVESLINQMKNKGIACDIIPYNINYTTEIIATLNKLNQDTTLLNTEVKISKAHLKLLKSHNFDSALIARDSQGNIISGPTFSVHHKDAVQDGYSQPNLAEVNYFNKLCLINDKYHLEFLHGMDETTSFSQREAYSARIYFTNRNTCFFYNFEPSNQIVDDYENSTAVLRRKKLDSSSLGDWEHLKDENKINKKRNLELEKQIKLNRIKNNKQRYQTQQTTSHKNTSKEDNDILISKKIKSQKAFRPLKKAMNYQNNHPYSSQNIKQKKEEKIGKIIQFLLHRTQEIGK